MIATMTLNPTIDRTLEICRLNVGGMNRVQAVIDHPSGKGINVSRTLKTFGLPTQATALLGGESGRWIAETLTKEGLKLEVIPTAGSSRTNLKIWSREAKEATEINEPGPLVSEKELEQVLAHIEANAAHWQWLVISGSMPPGVPSDFYGTLITKAKAQGAKIALDTSGAALKQAIKAQPDLIKPNETEAEELLGRYVRHETEAEAAAAELLQYGVRCVLLTLGKDGAFLGCDGEIWRAVPPEISVKSTVGCGDAALAGLLYGFRQGASLQDALRWSTAAGAANASLPGTEPPTLDVIQMLFHQVLIKRHL